MSHNETGIVNRLARPITESGEKFAKAEGTKAADAKHTTITIAGEKPQGGPGEVTIGIQTTHEGDDVSFTAGAWFRRVFQSGGSSAGVKGEIKF